MILGKGEPKRESLTFIEEGVLGLSVKQPGQTNLDQKVSVNIDEMQRKEKAETNPLLLSTGKHVLPLLHGLPTTLSLRNVAQVGGLQYF